MTMVSETGHNSAAAQSMAAQPMAAFEAEALPHMDDLFRAAVRMLQDHGKASDAVQEVYLVAWKSFSKYERGTNCKAWLFQILFNVVRHERRNWFKWITGKEEDLAEAQLVAPAPIPDTLTDGNILAALDKLPAQFREALLLVDVEEFSYKEASEILQVPIGTIMSRLNRARGLLRSQLADVARSYGLSAAVQE
ncbi:MAG: sigma-70 family RNA polymerase sigma factor [Acidobacteriia bacterium]|nr:sigma-70 family RNA polymerase sigma factor [Terriglobia bacterium]